MTSFEKRLERIAASLGPLPQKMTFIYADGRQVTVTGFLAATRQAARGKGLVDVQGANEGLKGFLLAAQCDISTLWEMMREAAAMQHWIPPADRARMYAQDNPQQVRLSWLDCRVTTHALADAVELCADPHTAGNIVAALADDKRLESLLNQLIDGE